MKNLRTFKIDSVSFPIFCKILSLLIFYVILPLNTSLGGDDYISKVAVKTNDGISFETKKCKIVLGNDARWKSIIDKSSGKELCPSGISLPFAELITKEGVIPAISLERRGSNIQVGFKNTETKLSYGVTQCDDWIHFQLTIIDGPRPERIMLCQVPVNITENIGSILNIASDKKSSVCLMAANFQPDCRPNSKEGYVILGSSSQDKPGPAFEGAAVALIICPTPEIRSILHTASHFFGLPINEDYNGVPAKETLGRQSYWFLGNLKESDSDKIIDYCRKAGFKQVMIDFSSWAISAGHIEYNTDNFPEGKESLRRFVKKLNDAGIGVGSHAFVSKIAKNDPYVTPVPDKRFWVDKETSLAADIGSDDTEIKVKTSLKEWPGSPVSSQKTWEGGVDKHKDVIIGDEIIKYKSIGPEGVYDTFLGCERGAYGTYKASHKAGDRSVHWGVDGCINGYIIDQETTLLDEVCDRVAQVFNDCGFNMIYFDGSEDVPKDRYEYYSSLAYQTAMKKFHKKPFILMGGGRTHRLWHAFTIGSTVDTYMNTLHGAIISGVKVDKWPTVKDHINRSVNAVIMTQKSLFPGELGWFGIWPKQEHTDGLQLDEIEYLMVKSLAYDAPISLETGFKQMDSHPLTPGILDIVHEYERIRMNREVPDSLCQKLKEFNKNFAYIPQGTGYEFVEMSEIPQVGGTHDVRSFIGELDNGDAVATLWHYLGISAIVQISPVAGSDIKVVDIFGRGVDVKKNGDTIAIPVGITRLALIFPGISKYKARNLLANATIK